MDLVKYQPIGNFDNLRLVADWITWKTTRCSKLQKSTTRYKCKLPFLELSRSFILSIDLKARRSSQSTHWICPLSYLFTSFSKRSNSPRSCLGTYRKIKRKPFQKPSKQKAKFHFNNFCKGSNQKPFQEQKQEMTHLLLFLAKVSASASLF